MQCTLATSNTHIKVHHKKPLLESAIERKQFGVALVSNLVALRQVRAKQEKKEYIN